MKKILNALFLTLLTVFTFSSCSDVPAPYDILGEGDVPGLTGDGTKENPYNIEAAQQKQDGSIAWVQGYIVGAIENVYDDKGEFAGNKASFTAPFTITSNVLIAESPDETNESKCLPVKIKNGSELSTALNLKDHPENKGGILLIQGELSAGFGKAALINTTAAVFNNKEIGEEQGGEDLDPDNPLGLDTSVAPLVDLSNNFDDVQHQADYSKAGWINKAVKGNRIWQGAIYDPQKYLAASTYGVNSGETAEYWFVTPYFTVNADKQFTFKATVNKYSETMSLKVFFLQMKDGKMERHEISVTGIPTSGTYQWTSDLKVDLSTYAGQNGFVGFQYMAMRGEEVQTYGIDDVLYGEGGGEVPGPGEGTELLTNGGFENWADGYPTGWKSVSTASSATLEQSTDKRSGTSSVLVKGDPSSNKRLGSIEMTLKAGTYVFSAYFKAATADKTSARLGYVPIDEAGKPGSYVYDEYVNEITNADWVTKSYTFSLTEEKKICLVVMNPKSPGKDLLIDDASLKTEDGGIVGGGGVDPEPEQGNLVINPGFENWTAALPTAWDNATYNTGITKEASIVHGGNFSVKQDATATNKLQQEITIEGGKTYRISYWYLDNTPNARTRPWIFWVDGTTTLNDHVNDLRPSTYSVDNVEWQQYSKTLLAPATANKLRFEVRTYKEGDNSGFIYFDDFEVVEVKE